MNKVTMNLNEYDELRRLQSEVTKNSTWMCYPSNHGGYTSYYFSTKDEELINMAEDGQKLKERIDQLEKYIIKLNKRTLFRRIFNR